MDFLIFFIGDSGVKPPTALPLDLLPLLLPDIFEGLVIIRKTIGNCCLEFLKLNNKLEGRKDDNEGEKRPATVAEPLFV